MGEALLLLPPAFTLAATAWLGACFGSFSNVLIHRLPRNLSVVGPRSFCPACRAQVAWYDNLPVASWLLLRGRCRRCAAPIPVRYVLVELAGAACALVGIWHGGFTWTGLATAVFLLLLLDIAVIDWQHMIIPHTLSVAGMVLGLGLSLAGGGPAPLQAVLGLAVGAGTVLALSWGWKLLRGQLGMGFGDVMLMGMIGSFLGPWGVPVTLCGGALLGTLWLLASGRGRLAADAKLPFGTFLALAAAPLLLWGEPLAAWYLGRF